MPQSENLGQLTCNYLFLELELNRKPQRMKSRCNNICLPSFLQVWVFFSILLNRNKQRKFVLNREKTPMNSPVSVATAMAHEHFG